MQVAAVCLLTVLGLAVMSGVPPRADDMQTETRRVTLGDEAVALGGSLHGDALITYVVAGEAGQNLTLALTATKPGVFFDVVAPGGDGVVHVGAIAGNTLDLRMPTTGMYRISVYLRQSAAERNERADYRLTIRRVASPLTN